MQKKGHARFTGCVLGDLDLGAPAFEIPDGVRVRKRGDLTFILNFADGERTVTLDKEYTNLITDEKITEITLPTCGYAVVE